MTIPDDDDILPEYSLKGGVRGKYADLYAQNTGDRSEPLLDDEVEAEAHRHLELTREEVEGIDGNDVFREPWGRRQRTR